MDVSGGGDEPRRDRKRMKKERKKTQQRERSYVVLCGRLQPPNYRRLP